MSGVKVIFDKCVGCKACEKACPAAAISMVDKKAVIDYDKCIICGACVDACKFAAIEKVESVVVHADDFSSYKGVWVFAEQREGELSTVAFELLSKARELATDLDTYVGAVLLGENVGAMAQEL
ncbi:TPA: electron transfer flavoprotein subunit alpha, partial [Candidatus Sumerlaeota bacterium]|nr:electron transfer flavoprotein subunit alpha [Candidatus Sumerlaeota bacterium]